MECSEEVKDETSEAPKTSDVKTEVKTDMKAEVNREATNGSSEVVTVDEDQRKLFVGGLAQVSYNSRKFCPIHFLSLITTVL